jgi:hypothetical protein
MGRLVGEVRGVAIAGNEDAMTAAPTASGVALEQEQPRAGLLRVLSRWRSTYMLVTLLVLLALGAWLNQRFVGWPIFELLFTLVMLSTVVRLSVRRRQTVVGVLLGVPSAVGLWLCKLYPDAGLGEVALALLTVFLLYSAAVILYYVLRDQRVDMDTLSAAFAVFLLIGFAWGCIYGVMYILNPGSFQLVASVPPPYESGVTAYAPMDLLIYFSFVTLATVGYGDILATSTLSRGMAMLEMVLGHFYLAVLIARLVGLSIVYANKQP